VAAPGATDILIGRTHEGNWPPGALERVALVTSTDPPGGLGSREISDKPGGQRGSSSYHIDRPGKDSNRT
jgi:iron complex transport system substrate-binding protein